MSATVFQKAAELLSDKRSASSGQAEYGTFIVGTVKDDFHDTGKNTVAANVTGQPFPEFCGSVAKSSESMIQAYELCGARSMTKFIHDLFTILDEVEAVMDLIVPHCAAQSVQLAVAGGYRGVWAGG